MPFLTTSQKITEGLRLVSYFGFGKIVWYFPIENNFKLISAYQQLASDDWKYHLKDYKILLFIEGSWLIMVY